MAIEAPATTRDLACVIHVHSTYSDGTATVPEIVAAARDARVDVVLLTDHDTLGAARDGLEGWHGEVLLVVGHEVSTRAGHFLAFGLEAEIDHRGLSEAEICAEVRRRGGFGFAAHPFSRGSRISTAIGRPHPWSALGQCGDCGIELWSLATDAAESWRGPRDAVRFLRDPESLLDGPPVGHLAEWDRLCRARRVPAIGGLDAHQTGIRVRGRALSPMPHERWFRLLRTHVLVGEPSAEEVLEALREGRSYLALDTLAPASGFAYWAEDGSALLPMGSEAAGGGWTLRVASPRRAELRLLRDGAVVARADDRALAYRADAPGVYRVEAVLRAGGRDRRWIVSNPVYLREAA